MRVDLAVGGRFHAFDLARELDRLGALRALHTGYPSFLGPRFGLRATAIHTVWPYLAVTSSLMLLARAGLRWRGDYALARTFDELARRSLKPGADVVVGWSNQCTATLQQARRLGAVTVVERGSTHIEWQRDTLLEERERLGLAVDIPDPRSVDRELQDYAGADLIAVPSQFVARTFIERGVAGGKLMVNPYGVDLERFRCTRNARRPGPLRAIHVGRVGVRKGVHYLIEATARAGIELTLVGGVEPGFEPRLRRKHISALGPIPGNMLPRHYADADVFCLLSLEEGLALVLAQAMAAGLPVIATPNTGAEELVTDGVEGFIVPVRDPGAVADRLTRLASDPDLRQAMGIRAQCRVARGCSWRDYGQRALNGYERVLHSSGRRSLSRVVSPCG